MRMITNSFSGFTTYFNLSAKQVNFLNVNFGAPNTLYQNLNQDYYVNMPTTKVACTVQVVTDPITVGQIQSLRNALQATLVENEGVLELDEFHLLGRYVQDSLEIGFVGIVHEDTANKTKQQACIFTFKGLIV